MTGSSRGRLTGRRCRFSARFQWQASGVRRAKPGAARASLHPPPTNCGHARQGPAGTGMKTSVAAASERLYRTNLKIPARYPSAADHGVLGGLAIVAALVRAHQHREKASTRALPRLSSRVQMSPFKRWSRVMTPPQAIAASSAFEMLDTQESSMSRRSSAAPVVPESSQDVTAPCDGRGRRYEDRLRPKAGSDRDVGLSGDGKTTLVTSDTVLRRHRARPDRRGRHPRVTLKSLRHQSHRTRRRAVDDTSRTISRRHAGTRRRDRRCGARRA